MYDELELAVGMSNMPYKIVDDVQLAGILDSFPDESSLLRNIVAGQRWNPLYQLAPGAGTLKFIKNKKPCLLSSVRMEIPRSDVSLTWGPVPIEVMPKTAIANCFNCTNATPLGHFQSFLGTFPTETLLMNNPDPTFVQDYNGRWMVFITYRFSFLPKGVNNLPNYNMERPFDGFTFDRVSRTGFDDDTVMFKPANFNNLFRPEVSPGQEWVQPAGFFEPTYNE